MDASLIPSVPEIQQQVRALNDSINRDDSASVESLHAFLHQIRACAEGVSKRLEAAELAREKAKKEELAREKAKKEELAREKAKKDELAKEKANKAMNAKREQLAKAIWDQIAALTAKLHELQGVAPAPDVPVVAISPAAAMPPPAPRPMGNEAKRAKKEPVAKSPVGRKAVGRGKGPAFPPFTGGGGVAAEIEETQILDDGGGEAPYEGCTQPPEF
jgi:hypothetical protein